MISPERSYLHADPQLHPSLVRGESREIRLAGEGEAGTVAEGEPEPSGLGAQHAGSIGVLGVEVRNVSTPLRQDDRVVG